MATDHSQPEPASDAAIESVSVLSDDLRRQMYAFIRRARRPVTRDEAAETVGISRKLAAFHLDKLVDTGLLRARYGAPGGIRKVGRQPKVYEPTDEDIRVSIPERRPDVLAEILIDAVLAEEPGENGKAAALRTARRRGEELGTDERGRTRPGRLGPERSLTLSEAVLERYGFEPTREKPAKVRLLNCPFHPLAARSPELVCGINHAFLDGFLTGLEAGGVEAVLAPRPGQCCVELRAASEGSHTDLRHADHDGSCTRDPETPPAGPSSHGPHA
ncbi:helix-turn-helix domain-containing protein [Kitasatospora atroaurantiaca]|uniref:Putative ArsR family transcriptional regulator n=1 Tax=Kitasatospora atroaurantiaca TaxID=285545 RepID=A0A561EIY0_9ACTN|nr:helix-turn-helix domain-containing protein [Kitasatospora atroaurantiaca]TWE15568.1 putative ArsR family transcriptional regulator [Kitasatospora atroaurantiaca]